MLRKEELILGKKLLIVLITFFILTNFILSEDLSFLEIDFLGEKTKILTTLKEKDSEVYIPLPLFSSTFKYEFKVDGSKIYLYRSEKVLFIGVVGEKKAILEEKAVNLFNPIIRENNIIYFPISSFFRISGYRTYLKDKTLYIVNELSTVEYSKGNLEIVFKSKSLIEFKTFILNNPSRFVIDLLNVVFINNKGEVKPNDPVIKSIRFSQFNVTPYIVRVVIEFRKEIVKPDIVKDAGKLILKFPIRTSEDNIKNLKLTDLSWENTKEGLTFFLKFSDSDFTYTKKFLPNPPRYYYDFPNTVLGLTYTEVLLKEGPINSVRIGERKEEGNSLRVVFETYTESININEEIYTGTLKITVSSSIEENLIKTENKQFTIFVDPGHGGNDPGAVLSDIKEKDLNLKVSLLLADKLTKRGYRVLLTRDKDISVSLDDRVKYINENLNSSNFKDNSILISIHTNAAFSSDVKGIEVCYATDFSEKLVKAILETFKKRDLIVRRAIKGKFYVLSRVSIPSVIIEMGFITNEDDRKLLLSEDFQVKLVDIIIEALEEYIKGVGGNE